MQLKTKWPSFRELYKELEAKTKILNAKIEELEAKKQAAKEEEPESKTNQPKSKKTGTIYEMITKRDDETKRLPDLVSHIQALVKNAKIQLKNLQEKHLNDPTNQDIKNKYEDAQAAWMKHKENLEELEKRMQEQITDRIYSKRLASLLL